MRAPLTWNSCIARFRSRWDCRTRTSHSLQEQAGYLVSAVSVFKLESSAEAGRVIAQARAQSKVTVQPRRTIADAHRSPALDHLLVAAEASATSEWEEF